MDNRMTGPGAVRRRRIVFGIVAAAGAVVLLVRLPFAGVIGSPHDFSATNSLYSSSPLATGGACSICHVPHGAQSGALWPRDLSAYDNVLGMDGGSGGSTDKPNYQRSATLPCYDCHDFHGPQGGSPVINNDPPFNAFASSHKPQNVAFGFTKGGSGTDSGSTMKEDAPAGTVGGYYENRPPYPTSPQTYYGADSSAGSPIHRPFDNAMTLAKSGGHYFKSADPASGAIYKGDKLPCSDCHDPHAWDSVNKNWQAFFRNNRLYGYPGRTARWNQIFGSSPPRASTLMANPVLSGASSRDDQASRKLCILCHGDSNSVDSVAFNDISAAYTNMAKIIRSPATVADHASGGTTACVACHGHNVIPANCDMCHGEPQVSGAPPNGAYGGNGWASAGIVDNLAVLSGVGDHRTAAGVAYSSHEMFVCSECHTGTAGTDNTHNTAKTNASMSGIGAHAWDNTHLASWNRGVYDANPASGPASVVDDYCSNINCHSPYYSANSFRSGTPYPYTRYWINATLWDCYTCHPYDGLTSTSRPGGTNDVILSGSHGVHIGKQGSLPMQHTWSCGACHADPGNNVAHKDGLVQVPLTGAVGPVTMAGSYTTAPAMPQPPTDNAAGHRAYGTCSNVYCHSTVQKSNPDGLPNDNVTYAVTPPWGSAAGSVACGACHKVGMDNVHNSATGDIDTGSHPAHLGVITAQFGGITRCLACHQYAGKTACTGCHVAHAGEAGISPHVDGRIDLGFSGNIGSYSLAGGAFDNNLDAATDNWVVPGMPYGGCRNLYCHSDGNGGAPLVNPAIWGDNTARTADCTYCHGGNTTASSTIATGSHLKHIATARCSTCHALTVAPGSDNALNAATGNASHVNGMKTVQADNTVTFAYTAGSPFGSCSGISCHGGNGATWGGPPLTCAACHTGSGDVDDFGSGTAASVFNNGLVARIDNVEWMDSGHGKASGTYDVSGHNAANFGRNAAPNPCLYCHDANVPHATASNPFRLADQTGKTGFSGDGWNATCLVCHSRSSPVPPGYDPDNTGTTYVPINSTDNGTRVDTAHYGIKHSSSKNGGQICWDCHNPHGDRAAGSGNIFMIGRKVTRQSDGVLGIPAGGNDNSNRVSPVFTANATGTDYAKADPGPYTGVCQVCHDGTVAHFTSSTGDTHNAGAKCTSCHAHDRNFAPRCDTCHGDGVSANWPDNTAGLYPDRMGAHVKHLNAIYNANSGTLPGSTPTEKKNATCDWCHPNPGGARAGTGETGHTIDAAPTGTADAHRDGRSGATVTYFRKMQGATDNTGTYDTATHACSNVNCHGGSGTTPPWYGDNTAPGNITSLAATPGTDWGTAVLRWTAPGNDGYVGTAFRYEVRYRTGGPVTAGTWATDNVAGGGPAPAPAGDNQSMTISRLSADNTTVYYYGIKAWDAAGNASAVSNSPSSKAAYDNIVPVFDGIISATPTDSGGTVNLAWNAAVDNTLPITYRVWWSNSSAINFAAAPNATTSGLDYRAAGLTNGTTYYFAVRAADNVATSNVDNNTTLLTATPAAPTAVANKALYLRRSNGVTIFPGLVTDISQPCGVQNGIAFPASPVPPSTSGFGDIVPGNQGLLVDNTAGACGANYYNYAYNTTGWSGGTWRWGQAFYYNTAFTDSGGTLVSGTASNNLCLYGYMDPVQIRFAAVTDSGTYTLSSNSVTVSGYYCSSVNQLDLRSLQVTVPNGGKFAILFAWAGSYGTSSYDWVGLDGHSYVPAPVLNVSVNNRPTAPTITAPSAGSNRSGNVTITWTAATDPNGNPLHYDVYGSTDNGTTYPYVIAANLSGTSTTWNTVSDQIGLMAPNATVRVRVEAGDGYFHTPASMSGSFTVDNRATDSVAPGAIANLSAVTTTDVGSIRLAWTAPGDDNTTGPASLYDIRYSASAISDNATFSAATVADNTLRPKPAGNAESYEVTGLSPGATYFFAIKTGDEVPNWSTVSNSPSAIAGANCGVCHASPPSDAATRGSHDKHGTTQVDCAKCHGTAAATYSTTHADGRLQLGFKTATPDNLALPTSQLQVAFRQSGLFIYQDNTGGGGLDSFTGSDNVDTGTCMNFNQAGVNATGCHAAGRPVWGSPSSAACGSCHGTAGRTGYLDTSGDVDGAPPNNVSGTNENTKVGKHLQHVNASYYTTGNSCSLCHNGAGKGTYLHGDETTQIIFNPAAGASASYDCVTHTCSSLASGCHPALTWDSASNPACTVCHTGFASHTKKDRTTSVACTSCHPGGSRAGFTQKHSDNGGTSGIVLIPLPPSAWSDPSGRLSGTNMRTRLGINYGTMNGIHLGGDNTSGTTEAEICWNCHKDVDGTNAYGVAEWGYRTKTTPSGFPVVLNTAPGNFPTLHDGTADRVNAGWIYADNSYSWSNRTADWTAGYWMNEYDNAIGRRVASVHSASFDPSGQSSSVASNVDGSGVVDRTSPVLENKSYIRCSYCHDVHDRNLAQNDSRSGKPFLRGTWVGDPYPPELPPRSGYSYPTGAPRNGLNQQRGGYFIDQNSGWPTDNPAMNTISLTAGLCTLCHGTNVDTMKFYTGSTLWLSGTVNGHSNSTVGGTRANARDLFDAGRGSGYGMAMQEYAGSAPCLGNNYRACVPSCPCAIVGNIGWYGSDFSNWYNPGLIGGAKGAGSMAHKFTCSKCHDPHAAGLPALLVHNCIDAVLGTPLNNPLDDRAANCHRKTATSNGWHKLAPNQ